jgi:hypothetical protein
MIYLDVQSLRRVGVFFRVLFYDYDIRMKFFHLFYLFFRDF